MKVLGHTAGTGHHAIHELRGWSSSLYSQLIDGHSESEMLLAESFALPLNCLTS
jgi:hypothetical protein